MFGVITLLLFQSLASAESGKKVDLPVLMEQMGDRLNQVNKPKTNCTQCDATTAGKDEKGPPTNKQASCMTALCGGTEGSYYTRLNKVGNNIAKNPGAYPELKELSPLIEKAFRAELEETKADLQFLQKELKAGTKVADPQALTLYALLNSDVFEHFAVDAKGNLDERATRAKLKGQSPSQIALALHIGRHLVDGLKKRPEIFTEEMAYLKQRLSSDEIKAQADSAIAEIDKGETTLASNLGIRRDVLFGSAAQRDELYRRVRQGGFNQDDIEELSSSYTTVIILPLLQDKKFQDLAPKTPVDPSKHLGSSPLGTIDARIRYIDQFLKNEPVADPSLTLHPNLKDRMIGCQAAIAIGAEFFPTEEQIKAFVEKEKGFRQTYLGKLKLHVSGHSFGTLSSEANKWRVKPPESRKEFQARFKRGLEALISESKDNIEIMKNISPEIAQIGLVAELNTYKDFDNAAKYDDDLLEFCTDKSPDPASDHALQNTDMLHLSASTVKDPQGRPSTAFHEYSHLMSGIIQNNKSVSQQTKGWYQKSRSCLTQGHGGKKDRVEEDWADLLAANFATQTSDSLCESMPSEDEYFSLKNPNPNDPTHSSYLYRLLQIDFIQKGKIPTACSEALKAKRESFKAQNCISAK